MNKPADIVTAELREKYGSIALFDRDEALRLIGLRDEIHPADVFASLYPSLEAAQAFAAANLEHYGHPTLATIPAEGGWLGVLDLRPCLAEAGIALTDPHSSPGGNDG